MPFLFVDTGLSSAALGGIIAGAVLLVVLIVVLLICCLKKRGRGKEKEAHGKLRQHKIHVYL